jgi:hypothetical protein
MTDVQICNLALARLGDARITSLSDATAQAQYCSLFYSQTLEELQTEFDWQFCRKLSSLTADPTPPAFGYSHRFEVPADFLRLIRLNGIDEDENFSKWEIVDGFIHTDLSSPAQIEYIANVTDASKFPAVFIEIFSAKLAVNLALPLTASKELFAQMAEIFTANIQRPIVKALILANAKSRPSTTLTEDELCRQAILRVGTAEQFGPSSQAMLLSKSLYPQVRDSLLLTGSWTWAMKSLTVAESLPRPEYKWAYRYAIPSDCLRVFRVNDQDYATGDAAWEVSGNFVLCNSDSGAPDWVAGRAYEVGNVVTSASAVYRCMVTGTTKQPGVTANWTTDWDVWLGSAITLEYVRKVTEVTLFDSLFIDLLTASLASKLAVPLTGDANKASLLAKETDIVGKNPAMRRDSTERKGRIKPAWMSSKLVSSRNGGDGIEAQPKAGGSGGGVSYPSLLVQVGDVSAVSGNTQPFVTNTGAGNTAVLNFGLPQAGLLSSDKTTLTGNGTLKTFTVTGLKSSDPNHVLVAINGVMQEPTTDYLVNQGAGTITFATAIPNNSKIVVVALGLYSPATQRDPDNYIHAFALNAAGTFSYYGLLLNSDIPAVGSPAAVAKWSITRSALGTNGTITATDKAANVAWTNRETATYA